MARKMLTEAQQKEAENLMEGWMSQAGEDHRRMANKLEAIGLTTEDFKVKEDNHDKQYRSGEGDFMRNLSATLDGIAEGTFGPHNLPGADKADDDEADDSDEDDSEDDKDDD